MNIFYLSNCPKKAAQVQYNKHVVKMILETAQVLCTAHNGATSVEGLQMLLQIGATSVG